MASASLLGDRFSAFPELVTLLCSSGECYQKGWMGDQPGSVERNKVRVGAPVGSIAHVQCQQGEAFCLWGCQTRSSLFINGAEGYLSQGSLVPLSSGGCLRESSTRRERAASQGRVWDGRSRSRLDPGSEVFVSGRTGCAGARSVALGREKPLSSPSALSFYHRS